MRQACPVLLWVERAVLKRKTAAER